MEKLRLAIRSVIAGISVGCACTCDGCGGVIETDEPFIEYVNGDDRLGFCKRCVVAMHHSILRATEPTLHTDDSADRAGTEGVDGG